MNGFLGNELLERLLLRSSNLPKKEYLSKESLHKSNLLIQFQYLVHIFKGR